MLSFVLSTFLNRISLFTCCQQLCFYQLFDFRVNFCVTSCADRNWGIQRKNNSYTMKQEALVFLFEKIRDFKGENRIRCWVDGADNLAKRERRTSTLISDRGPWLLFIIDRYKTLWIKQPTDGWRGSMAAVKTRSASSLKAKNRKSFARLFAKTSVRVKTVRKTLTEVLANSRLLLELRPWGKHLERVTYY